MPTHSEDPQCTPHGLHRRRFYCCSAALILFGIVVLRFAKPAVYPRVVADILVGCIFGTMFGQTTFASAWAAFGPLPLIWRLPLSLIWVAILFTAWELNLRENRNGADGAGGVMGAFLLGNWLLLQIPFWVIALGWRIRMEPAEELIQSDQSRPGQFSIAELIIAVAIVGVAFCVGRFVVPILELGNRRVGEWPLYRFLSLAGMALSLPLLLTSMMSRRPMRGTLVVLLMIAVVTFWEPSIMRFFGEHVPLKFGWINAWTAAWVLAFVLVARLSGYRLARYPIRATCTSTR